MTLIPKPMPAHTPPHVPLDETVLLALISQFMRQVTFEVTRPSLADNRALGSVLLPGMEVYVTALPGRDPTELVATAQDLTQAGLKPVAHIAARHFDSLRAIDHLLKRLHSEAGVTSIMLIGGDTGQAAGSVQDALQVIESGLLQANGIERVGLPGFPEGHPALSEEEVECSLVTKLAALQGAGLEAHVVTQFCFDVEPILQWLDWLRARGLTIPVRIGLAGPTSLMTWLKFASKCGVRASAEALAKRSGLIQQAFRSVAPDPLIRSLVEAKAGRAYGEVTPHIFSFGAIVPTARWAMALAQQPLRLTLEGGFEPMP